MFRLWRGKKQNAMEETALPVVLIGEGYRRAHTKNLLQHLLENQFVRPAEVVGELASGRRVELLSELDPEVVILDCASEGINPFSVIPRLANLEGSPRVVALVDGFTPLEERTLLDLGADAVADIQDPHALEESIHPGEIFGEPSSQKAHRDKSLATVA